MSTVQPNSLFRIVMHLLMKVTVIMITKCIHKR